MKQVSAGSPDIHANPGLTNPLGDTDSVPKATIPQHDQASLPGLQINSDSAHLQKSVTALTSPNGDPVLEAKAASPAKSPEQTTDPIATSLTLEDMPSNPRADMSERVTDESSKKLLEGTGSNPPTGDPTSSTPLVPVHNPLDDMSFMKPIDISQVSLGPVLEPAQEPSLPRTPENFCSQTSFTLAEAQAYARYKAAKGIKPHGFRGAPYVPLKPWACPPLSPRTVRP
jgi:hypothetical protein